MNDDKKSINKCLDEMLPKNLLSEVDNQSDFSNEEVVDVNFLI